MPIYNGEEYLAQSLDALLSQSYQNFELVISDNGSTDMTKTICDKYSGRDLRIKYFREDVNRGSNWNFSRVFKLSKGKYFKWAACDDLCEASFVEKCVGILEADCSIVCCHARTKTIDENGQLIHDLPDPTDSGSRGVGERRRDGSSESISGRFGDILLSSGWGVRCAGVFRTDALAKTGLLRPFYGSEKLMMAELCVHGRFCDLPEELFFQRVHSDSISGQSRLRTKSEIRRLTHTPLIIQLIGYLKIPWSAKLGLLTGLKCYGWVLVYIFQYRKWYGLLLARLSNLTA